MNQLNSFYSGKVLEHIRHPKNMGEIKNPDGEATVGNPVCGDIMKLYIKVKEGKIADIKFQTLGCGAAIASSSIITTMVKGKPLNEAEKITKQAVADALGGLPPIKIHCSVLAADALKKAIEDYRKKK
jgi:nitrogen fixation NifU-like protein